jgi:hypothetical protein
MADDEVQLDDAKIDETLTATDGPVGEWLDQMTKRMEAVAAAIAPVRRPGSVWNEATTTAAPIGWTKSHIGRRVARYKNGELYGSINAPGHPAIFLEYPRVDRVKQPFLTTALWSFEVF